MTDKTCTVIVADADGALQRLGQEGVGEEGMCICSPSTWIPRAGPRATRASRSTSGLTICTSSTIEQFPLVTCCSIGARRSVKEGLTDVCIEGPAERGDRVHG